MGRNVCVYLDDNTYNKIKEHNLQYSEVIRLGLKVYESIGKLEKLDILIDKLNNTIDDVKSVIEEMKQLLDANKKLYKLLYEVIIKVISTSREYSSREKFI